MAKICKIILINNVKYAGDTLMIAYSEKELTEIIRKLDMISREHGLMLNKLVLG